MENTKIKFGAVRWLILTTAVLLAVLFATETSLQALADSETGGRYVAEIITLTANSLDDAKTKAVEAGKKAGKTYKVFETPIFESDKIKTYMAYTTTNNAKKAITSIKTMNMRGGWGYEEYNKYLEELKQKAEALGKNLHIAIKEYVTNLRAESSNEKSQYAKKLLDYLYEEDSGKALNDLFIEMADKEYAEVKEDLIKIIMQSNSTVLQAIQGLLMIGCADTYKGEGEKDNSFLNEIEKERFLQGLDGYKNNPKYSIYDEYAQDIINSLSIVQEYIRFYQESDHPYTDTMEKVMEMQDEAIVERLGNVKKEDYVNKFNEVKKGVRAEAAADGNPLELPEEEYKAAQDLIAYETYYEGLSDKEKEMYTYGKTLNVTVDESKYTGYEDADGNSEYDSLLGLIMKYDASKESELAKYKNEDFYPIINAMSPGQRALLKMGVVPLIASVSIPVDLLDLTYNRVLKAVNEVEKDENYKITSSDRVSIYYGVDRSLYKPDSGIALTSEAIAKTKEVPFGSKETRDGKLNKICNALSIASGSLAGVGLAATMGYGLYIYGAAREVEEYMIKYFKYDLVGGESHFAKYVGWHYEMKVAGVIQIDETTGTAYLTQELTAMNSRTFVSETGNSFWNCVRANLATGLGKLIGWATAISIAIMIISILVKVLVPMISPEKDLKYEDIPRVMCSHQEIYGQKVSPGKTAETDYIYYYGVKNPLLGEAEKKLAGLDVTKRMINDISGWTLKGENREWVALYASTDSKAGDPILADSLAVTSNANDFTNGLEAVKRFNNNAPFDMHAYYGLSIRKNIKPRYIGYKMDTSGSKSASVFTRPSLWGGLVAGLILGGGIGVLSTFMVYRKRKKGAVQ